MFSYYLYVDYYTSFLTLIIDLKDHFISSQNYPINGRFLEDWNLIILSVIDFQFPIRYLHRMLRPTKFIASVILLITK